MGNQISQLRLAKIIKPRKLFQITADDWKKALSRNIYTMSGGLFRSAASYDPFEQLGYCAPAPSPTALSGVTGNAALFMTPFVSGGVGYIYAHGSSKLYQINTGTNAVTDATANVTAGAPKGAGIWRNKYIYTLDTEARKIELGAGTDTQLLSGLTSGVPHIVATGADLNAYITNGASIARLILETGTAGNSTNVFSLEAGQVAKDLVSDGRYLVIISDNNSGAVIGVRGKCRITFWDMASGTAAQIFEVDDAYISAIQRVGSRLFIIGHDNIYICSAGSPPQVAYSFTGYATVSVSPTSPAQVTNYRGVIYWGGSGTGVYAFGNPFNPLAPALFNPYAASAGNVNAIVSTGNKFYVASDSPQIYEMTGAVTRGIATLISSPIHLGGRFSFAFAKVVLRGSLASGDILSLNIVNREGGGVISDTDFKNFSTDPGKQVLLFYKLATAASVVDFEEIYEFTLGITQCTVERFEIWGFPLDNQYQG